MKNIIIGILAHANTGKTTLSEALLYKSGAIRSLGKVDDKNAFLDTHGLERERGITIFSKQAEFRAGQTAFTLIDTPGHSDFQAEMERSLSVIDYAILVISAIDLVTGHTKPLWELLRKKHIPTFIFVNKMDQPGADRNEALRTIKKELSDMITDFSELNLEEVSLCDEALLEKYLETQSIDEKDLLLPIYSCRIYPCFFGSALKLQGIDEFLAALDIYTMAPSYGDEFSARVYKISRDNKGERITFLKVTGGVLKSKMTVNGEEKVNQLRFYSGDKFTTKPEAVAGEVCAVTGLSDTLPGQGLGASGDIIPYLEPVLSYAITLPKELSCDEAYKKLVILSEEDPTLKISYDETLQEINIHVMGAFQTEILKSIIKERFDMDINFGNGKICYKETINNKVEGVGHFEPLRHYSEVHITIEPAGRGEGIIINNNCSEDILAKNWQRLIITHIGEKMHRGVLIGAPLTDVIITLESGKAHPKHTEGGDFRQATYRAIRQGLMQAESILLEPYYEYTLTLPAQYLGRALYDLESMNATINTDTDGDIATVTGTVPVASSQTYQADVTAYTKGTGSLALKMYGYMPCHNQEEIMEKTFYDPERDNRNPSSSVFCNHGSSFTVPWNEVFRYMHLESVLGDSSPAGRDYTEHVRRTSLAVEPELTLGTDEIDSIINKTFYSNRSEGKNKWKLTKRDPYAHSSDNSSAAASRRQKKDSAIYFLVDAYNIIHAFSGLKEFVDINIDAARDKLLDTLCNYQSLTGYEVIAVFDAYKVSGHNTEYFDYQNIHVVYTKEAETADAYIEKFTHENASDKHIRVATSDGMEQLIILGQGAELISAREFEEEIEMLNRNVREMIEGKIF